MRIDHAPYISEVQSCFCPEQTVRKVAQKPIIKYDAREDAEIVTFRDEVEVTIIKSEHIVIQTYVLRKLSDSTVKAVAIVSSRGGWKLTVNEWNVSLISVNTKFGAQLYRSVLFDRVTDDAKSAYLVANTGGGDVCSMSGCIMGNQVLSASKKRNAKR